MSLKDKASYIFKPSRYKAGTAFTFRGGDLVSSRGSTATRVNAQGYIETVAANVPRINYDPTDLTKEPWILYEDSAANQIAQSNTFTTTWVNYQAGLVANAAVSPDGTSNAWKLYNPTGTSYHFINYGTGVGAYLCSVFVKPAGYAGVCLTSRSGYSYSVFYNLLEKTSTTRYNANSNVVAHGIEEYKDGWFRVWVKLSGVEQMNIHPVPHNYTGTCQGSDQPGDGVSGIYIWQAQAEVSSAPTSIIPTSGSTATRSSDTLYLNSVSSVIGSGQGVVYCDFYGQPGATGGYENMFSISTGSISYSVQVFKAPGGTFYYEVYVNGSVVSSTTYNSSSTTSYRTKMAIYYANNDFGLYINGVKVHSDLSGTAPTGLSSINFNAPAGSYPGTKDLYEFLLFKERLSDEELVALTSFDDYEELVDIKDLTWESSTITNNRLSELAAL